MRLDSKSFVMLDDQATQRVTVEKLSGCQRERPCDKRQLPEVPLRQPAEGTHGKRPHDQETDSDNLQGAREKIQRRPAMQGVTTFVKFSSAHFSSRIHARFATAS